jgi:CTP synthase
LAFSPTSWSAEPNGHSTRRTEKKLPCFATCPRTRSSRNGTRTSRFTRYPLSLQANKIDDLILKRLGLPASPANLDGWHEILHRLRNPEHEVSIALVGKYAEHRDAYKSIYEALDHGGIANQTQVRVQPIKSEAIEEEGAERLLAGFDALIVPGGFGERGIEGKVQAIRYARERNLPFLGICLGMQCAVIDFARHAAGMSDAHSTEFFRDTPAPSHLPDGGAGGGNRQGGHHAAGQPAGKLTPAAGRRQPTAAKSTNGTGIVMNSIVATDSA